MWHLERDGSPDSTYRLSTGEDRKAPRVDRIKEREKRGRGRRIYMATIVKGGED